MKKTKPLATAPTLERIRELTSQYLYGNVVTLIESGENKFNHLQKLEQCTLTLK